MFPLHLDMRNFEKGLRHDYIFMGNNVGKAKAANVLKFGLGLLVKNDMLSYLSL